MHDAFSFSSVFLPTGSKKEKGKGKKQILLDMRYSDSNDSWKLVKLENIVHVPSLALVYTSVYPFSPTSDMLEFALDLQELKHLISTYLSKVT